MKEIILITGGAGMIGSNLAHWLLENTQHEVIINDDLSGGQLSNLNRVEVSSSADCNSEDDGRLSIHGYDVCSRINMDELIAWKKPTIVYHLAAYAAENLSPFIRNYNYKTNLLGTTNIVNACIKHNVKRLVFTSSIAVYGHGAPPFNEVQQPAPNDPYGIAKFASEMDIRVAGEQHGLDWCVLRPFNVYGERQNIWDKYRNVIGIWMYNHMSGLPLQIFGDGEQRRGFTYVGDLMEPFYKAGIRSAASKQIINIGSETNYRLNDLASTLIEIMGGGTVEHLPARHEVEAAYCVCNKARGLLDYKDRTDLHEGLRKMWRWAIMQPQRERKEWSEFELETGLYPIYKKEKAA